MTLTEIIYGKIGAFLIYAKDSITGVPTAILIKNGKVQVDASVSIDTVDIGAVDLQDGAGNPITSTDLGGGKRGLDVNATIQADVNTDGLEAAIGTPTNPAATGTQGAEVKTQIQLLKGMMNDLESMKSDIAAIRVILES